MNDSGAYGPEFTDEVPRGKDWDLWRKFDYAVQFDCADLTGAELADAGLVGVLFGHADMKFANLNNSNVSRADFTKVRNLDKVHFGIACADERPYFPAGFICELRTCSGPPLEDRKMCHFERPNNSDNKECRIK